MTRRILGLMMLFFMAHAAVAEARTPSAEEILAGLEKRYAAAGVTARFTQASTLEAMGITDTAEGRLWIRKPGQMRWEYTAPERQTIVSDGTRMWIYRPEDRQVMVGAAPSFFGDGKGAGFLADIGQLRRQFDITASPDSSDSRYGLTLMPNRKQPDLVRIELEIAPEDFTIETITTFNAYGDKTRIALHEVAFHDALDDSLFSFEIPEGVEIMQMEP
jgi:outer membrane lipoprotein carrier protein